jgi:hypothetical protein
MSIHRAPSAGALIKKILEINPEMGTHEMIAIVRQCTRSRGGSASDFASAEVIDEEKALRLARESLKHKKK